ncbi:MAG: cobalamin B12-binding domain-containing protein [Deltaproteobacteria bacterium]|jgi:methylmalonyl-CoA mutase C-terminal domain/subunit|nr:cobalamin B12-binding domain-containing protein [Deltaproteobacteria bacterium]
MTEGIPIRVLIAKPGLDGHDVGAKVIVQRLRNAGMEVIYTGLRQSPEKILFAAIQEDVDVLGLSILSGSHVELCQELMEGLREKGIKDLLVIVGGIIPREDIPLLKSSGVDEVFPVHSTLEGIEKFIRDQVSRRRGEGK